MHRELVERAQGGDQEAFCELARASSSRLYALASLILGDSEQARDALQDGLLLAWRGITALREPDAWEAWSNRLTVRACYKLAQRERRRAWIQPLTGNDDTSLAVEYRPAILDRDQIERGFRTLAPDQRAVMVLHFYLGLPMPEVAEVLGIPTGTAKSRLHRGLVAMRAQLDPPDAAVGRHPREVSA
jgi:RNA polymerase sigma factor (sigma-70 family)